MDVRVSGHQLETGEALRTHVETRLGAIADKYFPRHSLRRRLSDVRRTTNSPAISSSM